MHDQYSSNEFAKFFTQPNTPLATTTPFGDIPKTPYTDHYQTPDTYNAPMTYDHVNTPMTFDPSTPSGYGTVNTPGGYMAESNAPANFQRLDKIVVVDGEFKGKRGFIANLIDNSEGIVKFVDNEIKILKYVPKFIFRSLFHPCH